MADNSRRLKKIFPQKLWELVNDRQLDSAIRWTDDGSSFYIFDAELSKRCLGKENSLFFTKKPKSFVRQLHLYGFKKIHKNQFKHPCFHRERPHLVNQIRRDYKDSSSSSSTASPTTTTGTTPEINSSIDSSRLMQVYQNTSLDTSLSDYSLSNYSMEIEQPPLQPLSNLCVCADCCAL